MHVFTLAAAGLGALSFAFAADVSRTETATFAKDVAPIFQEKCQECHNKTGMAPMSLVTYEEVRPWAKSIRQKVVARQMPPWHIDMTVGVSKFKNDMSLSTAQIDTITRWVDSGATAGDPKDMPPAKTFAANDWKAAPDLGQPDMVIKSDPYTMPAKHQDVWWRPMSDIPITEARWVRAVEMRPGTLAGRKITHHSVTYLVQDDPTGQVPGTDAALNARPMFMEWAIGKGYDYFRPETGRLLVPGAKISWDIHYHAVGQEVRDNIELAIWFYPKGEVPKHRTFLTGFQAIRAFDGARAGGEFRPVMDLAPNSLSSHDNYTVLKQAARIENFQPHMHLRGKAMTVDAILPDGRVETISHVNTFNFNWMTNYIFADDAAPIFPKGTMIHVTAWYDNTRANPNNPDPDQWVGYGDRTVDEMGHAWMNVTYMSDEEYTGLLVKRQQQQSAKR